MSIKWNLDTALLQLKKMDFKSDLENLSESDTRSKLIDRLLIDVLGWSEENIKREECCRESGTYLDYKLSTNLPVMIIEAKKSSLKFDLPKSTSQRYFKVGGVLANCKVLVNAMLQARDYAISKGISFCCVTNGTEFVFYRSQNQQGVEWIDHSAIIFRGIEDIKENFDFFCSLLSKDSSENGKLQENLRLTKKDHDSASAYNTLNVNHLTVARNKNRNPLYPYISEVVYRVFQDLASESADSEILEHCYVDSPKKQDKKSPFIDIQTSPLIVSKKEAGDFQKRILASLQVGKTNHKEIILLLGSVGVGKSTFIQRFRKVLAKSEIDKKGIWIYINFKHFSDTGETLDDFVFKQIEESLNEDYDHLEIHDWTFLKQVYHSEYNKMKKGRFAPLFNKDESEFDLKFGDKVDEWMSSAPGDHLIKLLKTASNRLNRSVFLIFDNADQLNPETQNDIFLISEKLSTEIGCYALLSMREESYWKTRDAGPLNAFHTTAYNVQPATFEQVLSKRFKYARNLLEGVDFKNVLSSISTDFEVSKVELLRVFDRLVATLLGADKRYIDYIDSMSARDTRRALDTVAAFMVSGHTNLAAIIRDERKVRPSNFPVPFHEFLNAIILREHETYSEANCDVLNLFNTAGAADTTNFNRIIVLGRILHAKSIKSQVGIGYIAIEDLVSDCSSVGLLPDTVLSITSNLNRRRIIETETSIKDDTKTSKYVRVTSSGKYYLENLVMTFPYLEIVLYDTPIGDKKSFEKMNRLYGELNRILGKTPQDRYNRVKKRIELTESFLDYLYSEFQNLSFRLRKDIFDSEIINLIQNIRISFNKEKKQAINNAELIFNPSKK
jgi:energy-coupling factor transporter ATP-binding protein EcfA2/DNA-binding PadR family transcriptional regulator